jgi:1,3-beta-glucanosyltransferase GAS1
MIPLFCCVVLLFCGFQVGAISPLSITGTKFFNAEGEQIFFKGGILLESANEGIAYQRSPEDPLTNMTQCQLDAALMQKLGANVIRCSAHIEVFNK